MIRSIPPFTASVEMCSGTCCRRHPKPIVIGIACMHTSTRLLELDNAEEFHMAWVVNSSGLTRGAVSFPEKQVVDFACLCRARPVDQHGEDGPVGSSSLRGGSHVTSRLGGSSTVCHRTPIASITVREAFPRARAHVQQPCDHIARRCSRTHAVAVGFAGARWRTNRRSSSNKPALKALHVLRSVRRP